MADDIGRCVNCGFLGKRRTVVDAESIVYTATGWDRQKGTFYRESGWPDRRDMPTEITCFRNATNLQKEVNDALAEGEHSDAAKQECAHTVTEKDRRCKSWYPWTEYLSPKEHLEEFKEGLNRRERKRTDRILIGLTWALAFFAIVQIYQVLAQGYRWWPFNLVR
ncbi:hypothetical protein ACFLV4_04215 [Chloroflexota bacterium]